MVFDPHKEPFRRIPLGILEEGTAFGKENKNAEQNQHGVEDSLLGTEDLSGDQTRLTSFRLATPTRLGPSTTPL